MVIYSNVKQDVVEIHVISKDVIADVSEDYWEIFPLYEFEKMQGYIEGNHLLNLMVYDVNDDNALDYLIDIRSKYRQSSIMLLADTSMSPMKYMRPDVRADSLLLKPWTKQQARIVIKDFLKSYVRQVSSDEAKGENTFVIETKEGMTHVPYDQIYFFEAREKKVYACIGKEAYGFYGTIDKLMEELPSNFIRCHRGFIVNKGKIDKVVLSQSIIYLEDGFDVPLSRSYKATFKGMR
jgi:DNA-binding LytR/AlgR family response regulator